LHSGSGELIPASVTAEVLREYDEILTANCHASQLQGTTRFWPTGTTMYVADTLGDPGSSYSMRVLMRFDELHAFIPATATINSAVLTLVFENWETKTNTVQVG
jgi:hypothetical protein